MSSKKTTKPLSRYSDEELLKQRFCDLDISLERTMVSDCVDRLYQELSERGILIKPHVWLSDEWFSPDGVPGIAIPFYLAHPRLQRLEKKMMHEVEGGTLRSCMKILRHEVGHTVCTAYRLHYNRRWRKLFGNPSKKYPESYRPKSVSKNFVLHLDWWYAQAHPDEDFAETFAVWLGYPKRWRQQYKGWPALKKLEFVDELMAELSKKKPSVLSRRKVDPVHRIHKTLREHYDDRRKNLTDTPEVYDRDLLKLFQPEGRARTKKNASQFLRKHKSEIRDRVVYWTGEHGYSIDQFLNDIIERCSVLKLKLDRPETETKANAAMMVAVQTMNFLYNSKHRISL